MKECKEIRERLSAFIDNELPPQESRLIENHLHECPECAQEESSLRHVIDLLDEIPEESPSRSFTPATIHRVSFWKRCAYVREYIYRPAVDFVLSGIALIFLHARKRRDLGYRYLRDFDDFPPESLSGIYITLIQGDYR